MTTVVDTLYIGCGNSGSFNGQIALLYHWQRGMLREEIVDVFNRPFQMFELPRTGRQIKPAAGGFKPYWASQRSQVIGGGMI